MPETTRPLTITREGKPLSTRAAQFRASTWNPESRTVRVSLGTGAPVLRYDWERDTVYTETLSMDPAHIRLDRMNNGAPFLEDHNSYSVKSVVGRFVPGTVRIEDGELVGDVRLSKAKRNEDTVGEIIDGILVDTSAGYHVHAWEVSRDDAGHETRTAVDWEPVEGSIVPVPADPTGGVRSAPSVPPAPAVPVADTPRAASAATNGGFTMDEQQMEALRAEGRKAEAERQRGIRALLPKTGLTENEVRHLIDDPSISVSDASVRMWDLRAAQDKEQPTRGQVQFGQDEGDVKFRSIAAAIETKAGLAPIADHARHLRGATTVDLAREYLRLRGIRVEGRGPRELCEMAVRAPAGHTTSDFTSIYSNVLNKKLRKEYEIPTDYDWWKAISMREDFADDRARRVAGLSGLSVLQTVAEGADYEGLDQDDSHEDVSPTKKGGEFRMTLEMMVRDDLSAFNRQAVRFAKACKYTEHAIMLAGLTATLSDGHAVCSAAHSNIVTAGGTPSVARIAALDTLLRNQTDEKGNIIGQGARVGLFPTTYRTTVEQIYSDKATFTTITDIPTVPLTRLYVPGLSTIWFLHTGDVMSMIHGWVAEDGGPVVTEYSEYKSDSVIYHGRDWFGGGVVQYRDFACDDGAT